MHGTKIPKKKFDFYWLRDLYAILKIRLFWKLTTDFETRQKHRLIATIWTMEGQNIKAISSKTDYGRISTQKNQLYTSGFFAQIQNCDKMVLVKRIWLVIIQIKTSTY